MLKAAANTPNVMLQMAHVAPRVCKTCFIEKGVWTTCLPSGEGRVRRERERERES